MSKPIDVSQLPKYIDHTLLKADATKAQIAKLCEEAKTYQFFSVCVNSYWVPTCRELLEGSEVKIAAVAGFPLGANSSKTKAFEAANCVENGAKEIDMVLAVGSMLDGDTDTVFKDIQAVTKAVENKAIVKVILETGFLNNDQIKEACQLSEQAGAHFVKTSTGFGPGGATVDHVRLMRATVSDKMEVKASGGIRDLTTALQMIEAGATRLGASSGVSIMKGTSGTSTY
ncbi:deoxyribose-phosphate aldolase [Chengkuizengella sediminis]|uniref:deoxyribose-phosphate aldolase n=1 Tax=Chengkuizengella sediminis TaxID=1885917 RepID=UPI0013897534|nr:deoxyribose-phosphate aldolase [Chengkuizengella sediminis]NDI33739.1 deoxyribose-phosphate aldolase [Chengkuizengella sediminis]